MAYDCRQPLSATNNPENNAQYPNQSVGFPADKRNNEQRIADAKRDEAQRKAAPAAKAPVKPVPEANPNVHERKHPSADKKNEEVMEASRKLHPVNPSTIQVDDTTIGAARNPAFLEHKIKNAENQEYLKEDGTV